MKDFSDNGKKATGWVKKKKVSRDPWSNSQVFYFEKLIYYWLLTLTKLGVLTYRYLILLYYYSRYQVLNQKLQFDYP